MKTFFSKCLASVFLLLLFPVVFLPAHGVSFPTIEDSQFLIPSNPTEAEAQALYDQYGILVIGARSDEILRIKERLYQLGYFPIKPLTSIYSPDVADALMSFQKDHGLRQTDHPFLSELGALWEQKVRSKTAWPNYLWLPECTLYRKQDWLPLITVPNGTYAVPVGKVFTEDGTAWYEVTLPSLNRTGYISADLSEAQWMYKAQVKGGMLFSLDDQSPLFMLKSNAEVTILGKLRDANGSEWLHVRLNTGTEGLIVEGSVLPSALIGGLSTASAPVALSQKPSATSHPSVLASLPSVTVQTIAPSAPDEEISATTTQASPIPASIFPAVQGGTVKSAKAESEAMLRTSTIYFALYICIPVLLFFIFRNTKRVFTSKALWLGNLVWSLVFAIASVLIVPGALYNPILLILYDSALALGKLTVPYFLGSCMATLIISLVQRTGKQGTSEGASEMQASPGREQPLYGIGGFLAFVAFRLCAGLFSSIGVFFDGLSNFVSGRTMDASYMILYLLVDAIVWFTYFLSVVFLFKKKLIFRSFYCAGFFLQLISFMMLTEAFFWEVFIRIVVLSLLEIPILLYLFRSRRVRNTYGTPDRFNRAVSYDAPAVDDTPSAVTPSKETILCAHSEPTPISDSTTIFIDQVSPSVVTAAFCKHCGRAIDPDSSFCRHCGGPQTTPAGDPPARQRRAARHQ